MPARRRAAGRARAAPAYARGARADLAAEPLQARRADLAAGCGYAVSYTHLTLPTIYSV